LLDAFSSRLRRGRTGFSAAAERPPAPQRFFVEIPESRRFWGRKKLHVSALDAQPCRHKSESIDFVQLSTNSEEPEIFPMSHVLIAAAATAAVFALFILAFLIRTRNRDEPVHIHRCANCDCDRSEDSLHRSRRYLKQRDHQRSAVEKDSPE